MRPNRSSVSPMIRSAVSGLEMSPVTQSRSGRPEGLMVREVATTAQP